MNKANKQEKLKIYITNVCKQMPIPADIQTPMISMFLQGRPVPTLIAPVNTTTWTDRTEEYDAVTTNQLSFIPSLFCLVSKRYDCARILYPRFEYAASKTEQTKYFAHLVLNYLLTPGYFEEYFIRLGSCARIVVHPPKSLPRSR